MPHLRRHSMEYEIYVTFAGGEHPARARKVFSSASGSYAPMRKRGKAGAEHDSAMEPTYKNRRSASESFPVFVFPIVFPNYSQGIDPQYNSLLEPCIGLKDPISKKLNQSPRWQTLSPEL
jgi:hypothetical protein